MSEGAQHVAAADLAGLIDSGKRRLADLEERVAWLEGMAATWEGIIASAIAELRTALTDP